jgi:glycosyltransferase involved in cell wall biosynthesis
MLRSGEKQILVSVIVPVLNDAARLEKCLSALRSQTVAPAEYEIIVVDNGSSEDIATVTRKFGNVKLLRETRKGSYAARNRGIEESRGQIMAFTDADCLPARDWLEKGIRRFSEDPQNGVIGGKIEFFFAEQDSPTAAELYESFTYLDQRHFVENLHFSATANLLAPRRVFTEAGLFSPELQSGGDYEWGRRVFARGYRVIYADEVQVRHPARSTVREVVKRQRRIRGGAWRLRQQGVEWVNPHELSLLWGLIPPIRRSSALWRKTRSLNLSQKLKLIGIENFSHYVQWAETVRLSCGGEP